MSARAQALFANEAFYQAFRQRDLKAMEQLWALNRPVACIHPGWSALTTRDDVIRSWRGILENPESPAVVCRGAEAFPQDEVVFVLCYESVDRALLVATNVFIEEDGAWKIVHHQAGPCNPPPEGLPEEDEAGPLQ